jgi:hypothetical protein
MPPPTGTANADPKSPSSYVAAHPEDYTQIEWEAMPSPSSSATSPSTTSAADLRTTRQPATWSPASQIIPPDEHREKRSICETRRHRGAEPDHPTLPPPFRSKAAATFTSAGPLPAPSPGTPTYPRFLQSACSSASPPRGRPWSRSGSRRDYRMTGPPVMPRQT